MLILVCYVNPPVEQDKRENTSQSPWQLIVASLNVSTTKLRLKTIPEDAQRQTCQVFHGTHRPVGIIYPIHANFCYKSNSGGCLWVSRSTFHFQTVYPVLIIGLKDKEKHVNTSECDICIGCVVSTRCSVLTLAGPMIMPVHRVRVMSSSSSRPQLTVPSPSPFCPSSSSSNKRKLRGTLTSTIITKMYYRSHFLFTTKYIHPTNQGSIEIFLHQNPDNLN